MSEQKKLMPLFLVKPGTMSARDIRRAEKLSGIIVVECAEPDSARYSEAPFTGDIDMMARASMELLRIIMRQPNSELNRGSITKWLVEILLTGTKPLPVETVKSVKK